MTKDIEPKLKLISTYLKTSIDELFIIPEYQRSYSWTILECDKLWQDIEAFMAIGFTHHRYIIEGCKSIDERWYYIRRCATEFWNVDTLKAHIKADDFRRYGQSAWS